ncbi:MBG domain-containing protein [Adlercreutzia sp. R25]|uniref:MBG domain-containing protein n=1 Tax=Adlercreutzia shanghongiae TaxID=3111773 RepID=A0ABU6IVT4_9ACTN|nr:MULTISPECIES: MBG domain-containing protein [unclassified Adlercreutzia]MEC4272075.1 MBG domain-containing protein [Adlercreutzia sp. R25]MEC4293806.1 MBG domain-containing protein [Adlercreutzia sp. R22]
MRTIARFMDARNTAEGKFLSVMLSVLLVFSFLNVTMFTDYANAVDEETTVEETLGMEVDDADEAETDEEVVEPETDEPEPASVEEPAEPEQAAEEVTETPAEDEAPAGEETPATEAAEEDSPEAFEGYAHVGSIVVKVTADAGVVPAGTEVNAKRVNSAAVKEAVEEAVAEEGKSLDDYEAIDVTLVKDGQEIQPDGKVNVCFFDANLEGEDISVYHVSDNAATVTEVATRQAEADVQSFDVEHFSIYVVAATEKMPVTYKFYVEGELVDTQKIKGSETLVAPAAPSKDGFKFAGWTFKDGNVLDLAAPYMPVNAGTTEEPTVEVYAAFEEIRYVYFMDLQGKNVLWTESGTESEVVNTTAATATAKAFIQSSTQGFAGWFIDRECTVALAEGAKFSGSEPMKVYPKVADGCWVTFDSAGGTAVDPFFVVAGGDQAGYAEASFKTARPGYDFAGWYNGDTRETFESLPMESMTLTARWTPKTNVNYTVQYWIENADDDGYTYVDSETKTGTAGAGIGSLNGNQLVSSLNSKLPNQGDRNQFTYYAAKTQSENAGVTIAGDGSTIFNIYFERKTYDLKFVKKGVLWNSGTVYYNEKVKYDADLARIWEQVRKQQPSSSWTSSLTNKQYVYLAKMPSAKLTLTYYSSATQHPFYHYLESIDGEVPAGAETLKSGGKVYYLADTFYYDGKVYLTYDEDYFDRTGFTQAVTANRFNKPYAYDNPPLLYYRNSYTLQFSNGVKIVSTKTVPYEKPLSSYLKGFYNPEKPEGMSDYVFDGWHLDPACTDAVAEDATMPATNFIAYAKWKAPEVKATVFVNADATDTVAIAAEYNKPLSDEAVAKMNAAAEKNTPAGKVFAGWVYDNGAPFNTSTVITKDISIRPLYVSNTATEGATVIYRQTDGATASATSDSNHYVDGAYAKLLPCADEAPTAGLLFQGWKIGDTLYQPGDKIPMGTVDVVAVAEYGLAAPKTALTFDDNQGNSVVYEQNGVASIANNATLNVPELSGLGFSAPEGVEFIGWTEQQRPTAEAVSNAFQPGIKIGVDGMDGNKLYAQFVQLEAIGYAGKYDGQNHDGVIDAKVKLFGTDFELDKNMYDVEYKTSDQGAWTSEMPQFKDAGKYTVNLKATVLGRVELERTVTVTIEKRTVTITSGSDEKDYDGKPLTENSYKVSDGDGFVAGEGIEKLVCTGSQTIPGMSENTFTYTLKANTNPENYNITDSEGSLTVNSLSDENKLKATVTGASNTTPYIYDGKTTFEVSGFVNAGFVPASALRHGGEPAIVVTFGDMTYYVQGLTSSAKNMNAGSWPTTISGNEIVLDSEGNDVTAQFKVTKVPGTLTVIERTIVPGEDPDAPGYVGVAIDSPENVVYDGQPHQWAPTVTMKDAEGKVSELAEGSDYTVSYDKSDFTNVTGAITVSITGQGNYTGTVTRTYEVTPAELRVSTASASKVYDGTALTKKDESRIDGLVDGETAALNVTGSQTEVGGAAGNNSYVIEWGTAKESNYKVVESKCGTLTVTEYADEVVVAAVGGEYVYDGQEHAASAFVSELPEGYTLVEAVTTASAKDVTPAEGVKAEVTTLKIENAAGEDVTDKLSIRKVSGSIVITPAELKVSTASASKVYDGIALTKKDGWSIDGLVEGETAALDVTGSQTEVGGAAGNNSYVIEWDTAKASNYKVVESMCGTLTVTERAIVPGEDPDAPGYVGVAIDSPENVVYDGQPHQWAPIVTMKDAEGKVSVLREGTDYDVSYSTGDFTNVTGQITVTIKGKGNYTGEVKRTYKITPAPLTVSASKTVGYNGSEQTLTVGQDEAATIEVKGLVEADKDAAVTVSSAEVKGVDVGTYPQAHGPIEGAQVTIVKDSKDLSANYSAAVYGSLTITAKDLPAPQPEPDPENPGEQLGLDADSPISLVYNGEKQKWEPVVKDGEKELEEGLHYTVEYKYVNSPESVDFTNVVDVIEVSIEGIGNYSTGTQTIKRYYQITARPARVAAGDWSMTYGDLFSLARGDISAEAFDAEGGRGFVAGEEPKGLTAESNPAPAPDLAAQKYPGAVSVAGWEAIDKANPNYDIQFVPADLTVSAKALPEPEPEPDPENPGEQLGLDADSPISLVYNGEEQKWEPVVKDGEKELVAGTDYEVAYSKDDLTNVTGDIVVTITGKGNYAGTVERHYQITPAPLTISAVANGKVYGEEDPTFDWSKTGLIGEDPIGAVSVIRSNASVNEAGLYEGVLVPNVAWVDRNPNYEYTFVPADFRILSSTENDVIIPGINDVAANSIVKTYDGQVLTLTATAARENSTVEYSVDGGAWTSQLPTFLNAGSYEVSVRATNPNYETVEKVVTVVINRASVTVAAVAAGKVAGTADPALAATVSGLVNGETAGLIRYTISRAAGELVGSYQIVPTGLTIQGNYTVTYVPATLTISAAPVVPPAVIPVIPPATPTPATPTPATPAAPAGPATVVTAAAPAPAAAPAAPAATAPEAEEIVDDATPQAATPTVELTAAEPEQIEDEGTPMGAFDEPHCWVHWVMLFGILITAVYGIVVARRRLGLTDEIDDMEKQVLGIEDAEAETVAVAGHQAL